MVSSCAFRRTFFGGAAAADQPAGIRMIERVARACRDPAGPPRTPAARHRCREVRPPADSLHGRRSLVNGTWIGSTLSSRVWGTKRSKVKTGTRSENFPSLTFSARHLSQKDWICSTGKPDGLEAFRCGCDFGSKRSKVKVEGLENRGGRVYYSAGGPPVLRSGRRCGRLVGSTLSSSVCMTPSP